MSSPPTEYLQHILVEAEYVATKTVGLQRDQFLADETLKRAFVRSIEIIGEATKHVPDEFRLQHPQFEWRAMAGMRDRLIHGYFGVDYELVWDVAINKVPALRDQLVELLRDIWPRLDIIPARAACRCRRIVVPIGGGLHRGRRRRGRIVR